MVEEAIGGTKKVTLARAFEFPCLHLSEPDMFALMFIRMRDNDASPRLTRRVDFTTSLQCNK